MIDLTNTSATSVPCPFCRQAKVSVFDGASDSYGRSGVYAACENNLCCTSGPVVYFFKPEGNEEYEYLINEAPDRITAKEKALELWNDNLAAGLNNLHSAWEFYLKASKDSSADDVGASKDAREGLEAALRVLFKCES
ncbi:hypothetical protein [Yersinia ruckeri]|uniref:hypothetical protein n=1 Tax=Yersinia ruckeri TaxID=29486 RepID=UPI002237BD12|nr:hypothetical protein [Yersinia ruckeri]MCW6598622.1 hypothetical protein [Yersinia ruckeri]